VSLPGATAGARLLEKQGGPSINCDVSEGHEVASLRRSTLPKGAAQYETPVFL
jgi:hypothetical protein